MIRKFETQKACSSFKDIIWGADPADMQMISKFNKGFRFLFNKGFRFLFNKGFRFLLYVI